MSEKKELFKRKLHGDLESILKEAYMNGFVNGHIKGTSDNPVTNHGEMEKFFQAYWRNKKAD